MSTPTYPKRDKMFATRLMQVVFESRLALKVGQDGVTFLLAIAAMEDRLRYAGPVQVPQVTLQDRVGIRTHKGFIAARKKLVDAGWLAYVPGSRTQAPLYWVTIPAVYQTLYDSRGGVTTPGFSDPDEGPNDVPHGDIVADEVHDGVPDEVRDEVSSGDADGDTYKSCSKPKPINPAAQGTREPFRPESVEIPPELSTPEFREAWSDWIKHRREKGVRLTPEAIKRQFSKFVRAGPAVSVQAIDEAITAGWTSVWPEKVKKNGRPNEARNNAGASYQPRSGPRRI